MTFWQKFLGIIAIMAGTFVAGMATEYKFHLATETLEAQHETKKAQEGQNNIVQFHQQIQKIYVKDKEPCITKPMPDDIRKLLK